MEHGSVAAVRLGAEQLRTDWLLPLAGVMLLGLVLRLVRLDAPSLWVDELFTIYWVQKSFGFLWTEGMVLEPNPPLFYSLVKVWTMLMGAADAWTVRLFSVAVSVATIPMVALIGRELAGRHAGLLAALLFALTPAQVYFGQEGRTYALLILYLAVALLGLLRFSRAASSGAAPWPPLMLYAAGAVAMIYTHAFAAVLLAALNLCCLGWVLAQSSRRAALPRLVAVNLAVLLAAVPQVLTMLAYMKRSHELTFIRQPSLVDWLNMANSLLVDPSTALLALRHASLLSAGLAVLLAAVVLLARPAPLAWVFVIGVPALFLALALLIGLRLPFLMPRVVAWMSVPLALLAALALLSPRPPPALRGALALGLALAIGVGLHGVWRLTPEAKEDWRGVVAQLQERAAPDDLVVFGPESVALGLGIHGGLPQEQRRWQPDGVAYRPIHQQTVPLPRTTSADLALVVAEGRGLWLVLRVRDWSNHSDEAFGLGRAPQVARRAQIFVLSWPGDDSAAPASGVVASSQR